MTVVHTGPRRAAAALLSVVLGAVGLAGCGGGSGKPASSALISAERCAANRAAGTITYVSPFGFDASAGIIDVFAADKLGYFDDLCLKVRFVTNSFTSAALVSEGKATTTSTGSAADFLVLAASGANIKAVATYGNTSDYCIITRPEITTLKQLEGHTLGYHGVKEAPDLEMLRAAGVDLDKVKLINTPNYDPNQIVQGHLDAVGCYQSNEPLTLRAEHAKFNEFTPAQFGVSGTYNVVFFNRDFLAAHRAAAQDFMRADLHAFAYCEAHELACIRIEQGYADRAGADFPVAHEQQVWQVEAALSREHSLPGRGIGVQTVAEWQPEARAVVEFGLAESVPSLNRVQDTTLVADLYDGTRLIWP
jgi:NitT/TauT family transport system substrate-binding protein